MTILFADLAGSTALGERLDPEDVRALQTELFRLANLEVERFGGITEKFVGDAILAVFGIPQAHEDDAERAVRAGLAIQERFGAFAARVSDAHAAEVGLRIGVSTGEVVAGREAAARGELMVTGDAVNVAARLQQLAEPGEVLVGERTWHSTQRTIVYRERGELDAKGKSAPVRAWRAVEAAGQLGSARGGDGPFVGRHDEVALLRLAASRVARELRPQLVTVYGQAGVGKSRLVSEFVSGLDDARVLSGRCVPYGEGLTFLPLAEIASTLAGVRDDDPAATVLEKLAACVGETVPVARRQAVVEALGWTMGLGLPGRADGIGLGAEVRQALHDAWTTFLAELGRERLVVLVVEDIHWASEALLDLVESVLAGLDDTAVLVLCPSRPDLLDTRPTWATGRVNASAISLAPLGPDDAGGLLDVLLGSEAVSDDVAPRILSRAEGNPFFLEEMVSMLVEQGAIEEREGRWVETERLATATVPDSIHGVIAARIDLLERDERDALRRCSVMGRVFWPSAVEVDDDVVAGLGRRGIVSEQRDSSFSSRREFSFKHALTHEVAYATLPRYERGTLHRRVADWLAGVAPDREAETTELVAFHLSQALHWGGEGDEELRRRAFEATLAAGDAAGRRGAHASAQRLLGQAVDLADDSGERLRASLTAAQAGIQGRRFGDALAQLEWIKAEARAAGDRRLLADALAWHTRAAWLSGRWAEALEAALAAVAALDGLPEGPELARALSRLSQIQMLRDLPVARTTAERAIEVARRTNEPAAEANARINLFTSRAASGDPVREAELSAVVELAERAGAPDEALRAVVNYLWSAALHEKALEPVEQTVVEHSGRLEHGLLAEVFGRYLKLSLASLVYLPAGRWEEVDEVVDEQEDTAATTRLVWLGLVAGMALRRGRLDVADRYVGELRASALSSEEPQRIVPMVAVALPCAVVSGDREEATALVGIVSRLQEEPSLWTSSLPIARALAALGERAALARMVGGSSADHAPIVSLAASGLLAGLDGRPSDAAEILTRAESALRERGRLYDAACVARDVEAMLVEAGDLVRAEEAGARAHAVLEPLGCVNPY